LTDFIKNLEKIKDIEGAKALLFEEIEENEKILEAIEFTIQAHYGQKRKSGEPYVVHPILVSAIVAKISGDLHMIISALLHDVVEDTDYTQQDILDRFGEDVSYLVDGLTKIDSIRAKELIPSNVSGENGRLIKSALSFRKMLTASIKDIRILIIKLCDRVHNLLTLDALPENKQIRIAEESLVVYAPIAHRLGISSLKSLIEDYSFKYLFKDDYDAISSYIDHYEDSLRAKLHNFRARVSTELIKNGFESKDFVIKSRIKHKYSIYRKMQRKGINIDEVLDLLAIRIIVKTPIDTYRTLGIVHLNFKPLAFRFKDYIASPKENGYQTLHTTVIDKSTIFEVQIRTFEMDRTAEYGLAAHWKYKLSSDKINTDWIEKFDSYKDVELGDYYDLIKGDLFTEEITVYSPNYDIYTLPQGSVALDFAYKIHSDLGNRAKYAYVNKKRVSLLTELKSGDVVKIITDNKNIPRCTWIDSVKTQHAIKEIKALCNQRIREIDIQTGYNILKTVLDIPRWKIEKQLEKFGMEDAPQKVVYNNSLLKSVINQYTNELKKNSKFLPILKKNRYKLKSYKFKSLKVISNHNISEVRFDYCCHPRNGDDIVGVLQNNRVYVHHKMCSQVAQILDDNLNMVYIEWDSEISYRYNMIISLSNHRGALAEFLQYLVKLNIDVLSIKTEKDAISSGYTLYFELEIESKEKSIERLENRIGQKTKIIQITSANDSYKR